ncbi:MAG: peptidylprolyl isomerase [Bacteroidota bacterium]
MRLACLALAILLVGCGHSNPASSQFASAASSEPAAALERPADGLLLSPDLQALVDLQVRRDADGLAIALSHEDPQVRARAAFGLASVQAPSAVEALRVALGDPAPAVRADAAFALGQSADTTLGVALLTALRTETSPTVQRELIDAIGKVGLKADLSDLLRMPLPAQREADRALAVARLAQRDQMLPSGWAWLAGRLQAPRALVRENAAYAFVRVPANAWAAHADAVRAALDQLENADPARMHLARALGRLEGPQDIPRLVDALGNADDWRTRSNAARSLQEFVSTSSVRDALAATVANDPHALVALTAANALATFDAPTQTDSDRAAAVVAGSRPAPVRAALLPILARTGRDDLVRAQAAPSPEAPALLRRAALRALGTSDDSASLDLLFAAAADETAIVASTALGALRSRWNESKPAQAQRYFDAFAAGVSRNDLATTTLAAPALADSAFWDLGAGPLLKQVYREMTSPADVEPMAAILQALGQIHDGSSIDFLLGVTVEGEHPVLRRAARDALNERLVDGVDVEISGDDATSGTTSIDWAHLAKLGEHPRLTLETSRGTVVIEMDSEAAPQTVQMITRTAAGGLYDGVPFHRVVSNFVAQGGDYFRRDGWGGPETPIRSEFTRIRYETGTIGMASSGKDTEGVQFFVTHSPQPHLDGRYTAFGRVLRGQKVIDALVEGDLVTRARVLPDQRPLTTAPE